ncbi:MAG: FtsH protease activity modulator HflK [Verrucomicrobia bacterium]|jgi:membrane protease subunit HflK|nr:FtsH protease activity modulator HflK [Verrucomicrobiota bacterium]
MSYREPQFDEQLAQLFERVQSTARQHLPKLLPVVIGIGAALWLASGVYVVNPGHKGVVRTFGKETARTEPGLNYRYPWPFQRVDVVSVEQIRRIEVGFRGLQRIAEEALMLTGDENIVEAQIVVQYRVADPSKYLFRLREPEAALLAATEVALRSTVGSMTIDQVMIEERAKVQEDARAFIQRLMDAYESGLVITEVKLQAADPPDQVRDAFHDVVRAREDKEKLINQAKGYQADILPKARGEAQKVLREAEGYKEQRVLLAQGEAARFLSVLAEYEKAREVTRDRLHLETIEKILPEIDKIVIGGDVNQRLLPLLPLRDGGVPTLPRPAVPAEPARVR